MPENTPRAVLFIDGSNFYHGLKSRGIRDDGFRVDFVEMSRSLCEDWREWRETRYYVGQLKADAPNYSGQQSFLDSLESRHSKLSVHRGRIEERTHDNDLADELKRYLGTLDTRIDSTVYSELFDLADEYSDVSTYEEKETDVELAVDFVSLARQDEYDHAYILSADGDFVPAVKEAKTIGKRVYGASPAFGSALENAVDAWIELDFDWFYDNECFLNG